MATKVPSLKHFVGRTLLVRLSVATFAIAVLITAVTYQVQQRNLQDQVTEIGRMRMAELVFRTESLLERGPIAPAEAFRKILDEATSTPAHFAQGRFVFASFYDITGALVAEMDVMEIPTREKIKAWIASYPMLLSPDNGSQSEFLRIDGTVVIYLSLPIKDQRNHLVGYGNGLFQLNLETVAELDRTIKRTILLVLAIVFSVAALLYPVILHLTGRLAEFSSNLLDANLDTLMVLGSAIAKRDSDTDAHNYRVTLYSVGLAKAIGVNDSEMRTLIKGSFLHDVGKIGIPDDILLKPGKLDAREYDIMKSHVTLGTEIINSSSWLQDSVAVVGFHHEKFGGSGYPNGLAADSIPRPARIFAIVDVFDALTSKRPYKESLNFDAAMEILERGRNEHFDPAILDRFRNVAAELHKRYCGKESDNLKSELEFITKQYFSAGIESLNYK
jgi:HD-GYP domain-containing protein (c-di-GMP phosphodiesterase class II)